MHSFLQHSSTMSGKRKFLTLEDRVKVLERTGKGESPGAIALAYGCGRTQILGIIKDKVINHIHL